MKWTVGTKLKIGFGVALLIFVAIGGVSYRNIVTLTTTADWVTHTHRVLEQLDGLMQALTDGETGQRGFIITSEDVYLEPLKVGIAGIDDKLRTLRSLVGDNSHQLRRLDVLEPLVTQRVERLHEGIRVQESQGSDAAHDWVKSNKGKKIMDDIRNLIGEMKSEENRLLAIRSDDARAVTSVTQTTIVVGTLAALMIVFLAGYLITRNITSRLYQITEAARKIATGDLTETELNQKSQDEISTLAAAFVTMRSGLREMTTQIRQATENVNSTAAEVLASTQQQGAATKEQAATIQEITSTLEEINQSGGQIGERARQVSVKVEEALSASQRGTKATQDTNQTMELIRNQVEDVAENVVNLSERTQTIGEIIATVGDIAEQSNLLALNASIEAASAGEQGGRFSVVAHEMKNLADRAKDCTVQVRTILSEIQKGINTSVMLTEEAVKRVENGKQQSQATEATIREVAETSEGSIQAFQQIVAGVNQQQVGVTQVTQGMQDMRQAIKQTAAGTVQLEKAAASMNALGQQLQRLVTRYRI